MNQVLTKIDEIKKNIRKIYLLDQRPFVVGYSGGKDSTLLLQLLMEVLNELSQEGKIKKLTYIISSDTRIENPVVSSLIKQAFIGLSKYKDDYKIELIHVKPDIDYSFWVSVLGKGYPLPLNRFRWCTKQLKINPMQTVEEEILRLHSEIIAVLGLRKKESYTRKQKMDSSQISTFFYKNNVNSRATVFAPLSDLDIDTLWKYLLFIRTSFWGSDLAFLYEAYFDTKNECPMSLNFEEKEDLIEKCGNSRWGCWMCPMANHIWLDGLVDNGISEFKELADFRRNMIQERDIRSNRYNGKHIMWNTGKISLSTRGIIKLKRVNDNEFFIKKKGGRDKLVFKRNRITFSCSDNFKYRIISYETYLNMFQHNKETFFSEVYNLKFVIEKNNEYYIPGVGPYTISYRLDKLLDLILLRESYKNRNLEYWSIDKIDIISDEEISRILELNKQISEKLGKKNMLKKIIEIENILICINKR